jgi:hypothetical protein
MNETPYQPTEREQILARTEAEADLTQLINRVLPALPIIQRAVEDRKSWHKDIAEEVLVNLRAAVQKAQDHQLARRSNTTKT